MLQQGCSQLAPWQDQQSVFPSASAFHSLCSWHVASLPNEIASLKGASASQSSAFNWEVVLQPYWLQLEAFGWGKGGSLWLHPEICFFSGMTNVTFNRTTGQIQTIFKYLKQMLSTKDLLKSAWSPVSVVSGDHPSSLTFHVPGKGGLLTCAPQGSFT